MSPRARTKPKASTVNPAALSIDDAARLLSSAGQTRVTREQLAADVVAGAPTNADGTLHLVHYAAWLAAHYGQEKETARQTRT